MHNIAYEQKINVDSTLFFSFFSTLKQTSRLLR